MHGGSSGVSGHGGSKATSHGRERVVNTEFDTSKNATESSHHNFATEEHLNDHFKKHGDDFDGVYHSAQEYADGARNVIKNGIRVKYPYKDGSAIGYVKFMGNKSGHSVKDKFQSKFEFVGMRSDGNIATYHVKSGKKFWKMLNGNNKDKTINPF